MKPRILLILLLALAAYGCKHKTTPPVSCLENPDMPKLFIFIGEKVSVTGVKPTPGSMDAEFVARYKITERICGSYTGDTIEFKVFDHYGRPAFEKYRSVMLYVGKLDSGYFHLKYQFEPLYKTVAGDWAAPYQYLENFQSDTSDPKRRPLKVNFAEEVSFSLEGLKKRDIRQQYPAPFYRIEGGRAIALLGYNVPQLLEAKKKGVLGARGYFGSQKDLVVQDVQLEEVWDKEIIITKQDRASLTKAFQQLRSYWMTGDAAGVRAMSFDSVACAVCEGFASPHFYNDPEPIDTFTVYARTQIPGSPFEKILEKDFKKISARRLHSTELNRPAGDSLKMFTLHFDVGIIEYDHQKYKPDVNFQFVKENGQFRFHGMNIY